MSITVIINNKRHILAIFKVMRIVKAHVFIFKGVSLSKAEDDFNIIMFNAGILECVQLIDLVNLIIMPITDSNLEFIFWITSDYTIFRKIIR